MAGFSDLKKMSKNSVSALAKELEKTTESKSYKDDRFWSTERGKDGNGFAIIRFLPACAGEEVPWACSTTDSKARVDGSLRTAQLL